MYEIKKAKGGFMVCVKAENGEILLTSEILKTEKNAIKNVSSSLVNSLYWFFQLNGGEHLPLANSPLPDISSVKSIIEKVLTIHFKQTFKLMKPTAKKKAAAPKKTKKAVK